MNSNHVLAMWENVKDITRDMQDNQKQELRGHFLGHMKHIYHWFDDAFPLATEMAEHDAWFEENAKQYEAEQKSEQKESADKVGFTVMWKGCCSTVCDHRIVRNDGTSGYLSLQQITEAYQANNLPIPEHCLQRLSSFVNTQ